jgi:hypothetical protein
MKARVQNSGKHEPDDDEADVQEQGDITLVHWRPPTSV